MREITAKERYQALETDRQPFIDRAEACARLTIPSLFVDESHDEYDLLNDSYQSVGARGVNHLATKLLITMLPVNTNFFRIKIAPTELRQLPEVTRGQVEIGLSAIEQAASAEIERRSMRAPAFEALKQLLVAGNVLVYVSPKRLRSFRLNSYVVKRDCMGNPLEMIVKEELDPRSLDRNAREFAEIEYPEDEQKQNRTVELYTRLVLTTQKNKKVWRLHQEMMGKVIPKSQRTYPEGKVPYIPLRMTAINGEDYGRSYVEELIGDLRSLESLSRAVVEASVASSKLIFMCRPNGMTRVRDVQRAANGQIIEGNVEDVGVLRLEKANDLSVAQRSVSEIEQRIAQAFLLNSAIQRNAERVTAEEIRYMANELESALGGIYSLLAQEFQLPLAELILGDLRKSGKIPELPEDTLTLQVTTGVDALGRTQDTQNLQQLLNAVQSIAQGAMLGEFHLREIAARLCSGYSVDTTGLLKTQEEKQQEMMQAQQAQMSQQMMGAGMDAIPGVAQEMIKQQGAQN